MLGGANDFVSRGMWDLQPGVGCVSTAAHTHGVPLHPSDAVCTLIFMHHNFALGGRGTLGSCRERLWRLVWCWCGV
jgi:hypothetical protein